MKLTIIKIASEIMTLIGVICILIFTLKGDMMYGWFIFIAMMLLSGIIGFIFFRCPHCKKSIPVNGNQNQKYCPYCHEDLGMKPSPFSYYSKCHRNKNGTYIAYTFVGPATAIVTILILVLIIVAIMGAESLFKGIGIILLTAAFTIGILIGFFSRCIAGSAVKMDEVYLYYSRMPFKWKKYELEEIKDVSAVSEPFYHSVRGIVCGSKHEVITIPVATYKGGEEFMKLFTKKIGIEPMDVDPERVVSKHSIEGRQDEEKFRKFIYNLKKEEIE